MESLFKIHQESGIPKCPECSASLVVLRDEFNPSKNFEDGVRRIFAVKCPICNEYREITFHFK